MNLTPQAKSVLTQWRAAKPVMALMGEFSAGKSTLLNLLLDGDHLPTKVTATNLPSVWVTYSDTPFTHGLRHDGTLEEIDVDRLGEDVRAHYLLLHFGINAPLLTRTDIVDTPGISDPKLAKGATRFLGSYLDAVLWLSPANQAWRQTEKVVWSDFPKTLRDNSMVVLTRADKLRQASDLKKVMKRVKQETKDLFCEQIALNTPLAAASKDDPTSPDWENSGGKLFTAALEQLLSKAEAAHQARVDDAEVTSQPIFVSAVTSAINDETFEQEPADVEPLQDPPNAAQLEEVTPSQAAPAPDAEHVEDGTAEIQEDQQPTADLEDLIDLSALDSDATSLDTHSEVPEPLEADTSPVREDNSARPAPEPLKSYAAAKADADFSPAAFFEDALVNAEEISSFGQIKSFFEQTKAQIEGHCSLNPVHRLVLKQCLDPGEDENANVERLLEQAKSELADFDKDLWCVIAPG